MRILIIGCGAMGGAFASQLAPTHVVFLYDRVLERAQALAQAVGAQSLEKLDRDLDAFEVVLLAVKPKDLAAVAEDVSPFLGKKVLLVSILVGTPLKTLEAHFPEAMLIRAIPNLALRYRKGVLGLTEQKNFPQALRLKAQELFQNLGLVVWLPESKLDALSSLTGSGPAFACVVIESMVDSGILMGFAAQEAREYVLHMLEGTLALLSESEQATSQLKWDVSSPGGMTIHGLRQLEQHQVRAGLMEAFYAAYQKVKAMAQETR